MGSDKPVIIFVFPDCMGGVGSFNRNLINHTALREQCIIKVILFKAAEDNRERFTDNIQADEVNHFPYSGFENQYNVCKRLHAYFGEEAGCIVVDNSLPLNAVGLFGTNKKVVYLVHDYFYIDWALRYNSVIDAAIAHSSFFCDILTASSPGAYQKKAHYIPYGVELPSSQWVKSQNSDHLKLVFLGRLVDEKGIFLLKEIDNWLQQKKVPVSWTVIGRGPCEAALKEQWQQNPNISFIQAKDTAHVYQLLETQDVLVFPSKFEGTPVAIMEAMSRGVVPVVSDLPGGTRDMVTTETGVRCEIENVSAYGEAVLSFYNHPQLLKEKQVSCFTKSLEVYDIQKAADRYFSFLFKEAGSPVTKGKVRGMALVSRLDTKRWPNWLVYRLRKLKYQISFR